VVGAHVPVDVKETHGVAALRDTVGGERAPEIGGAAEAGQPGELVAQRFDLGRAVEAEDLPELLWRAFLEPLGSPDAQEGHEQQCDQRRAQAVERRPEATVDLAGNLQNAALEQGRQSEQGSQPGQVAAWREHGHGVLE